MCKNRLEQEEREKRNRYAKKYYHKNRDKRLDYIKKWRKENADRVKLYDLKHCVKKAIELIKELDIDLSDETELKELVNTDDNEILSEVKELLQ